MCSRDWRYLVLSAIDSMDFVWIKLMKSLSCWCYCPPGADTWLEASILSTSQSTSVPRPTKGVSKHGGWKASLWTHRFYTWSLWLVIEYFEFKSLMIFPVSCDMLLWDSLLDVSMIIVSQNTFYFILEEDVYIFDHTWKYMTILHITYIRIVSQYHIYIYVHHINHHIMGEVLYNTGVILYDVIYIYIVFCGLSIIVSICLCMVSCCVVLVLFLLWLWWYCVIEWHT